MNTVYCLSVLSILFAFWQINAFISCPAAWHGYDDLSISVININLVASSSPPAASAAVSVVLAVHVHCPMHCFRLISWPATSSMFITIARQRDSSHPHSINYLPSISSFVSWFSTLRIYTVCDVWYIRSFIFTRISDGSTVCYMTSAPCFSQQEAQLMLTTGSTRL